MPAHDVSPNLHANLAPAPDIGAVDKIMSVSAVEHPRPSLIPVKMFRSRFNLFNIVRNCPMPFKPSNRVIGFSLAAIGSSLFSMKALAIKFAFLEGASVELMMVLRMGFSLPIFLIVGFMAWRKNHRKGVALTPRRIMQTSALGVLSYYVCTWLDFESLHYISAQLERLILFLYPTFTAIFAWIFLKDKLTFRHAIALTLSYVGVAILIGPERAHFGDQALWGAGLVFLAAILFAAYVTMSKGVITSLGSPLFTSIAMSAAAIAILAHFSVEAAIGIEQVTINANLIGYGLFLAIFCTALPAFAMTEAISRIGPGLTSALGGLGPAVTALLAVWILHEPFGWPHFFALVFAITGALILVMMPKEKQPTP